MSNAAAVEMVSSSDDEDNVVYTLKEAMESWYYGKAASTIRSYKDRVRCFIKWLKDNYNRPINARLKVKHLRLYFVFKAKTCNQNRANIVVILSLCRQLFKKGILKKDLSKAFKVPKQKKPVAERVITPATVKAFFKEANVRSDSTTWAILAVLTYGGLRVTACSRLHCTDIKQEQHQIEGKIIKSYKIHVRHGKGDKARFIQIKPSVGENLYAIAQSKSTVHLFPSSKRPGQPLTSSSIALRIKTIAKKLGQPQISCHFFRHFFASSAMHASVNLVDISKALGHSNVSTTSQYLHASNTNVSASIDLTESDGEDLTMKYVPTINLKKEQTPKKKRKKKSKKVPKTEDLSDKSPKSVFI